MPTPTEIAVLRMVAAIEIAPKAHEKVLALGNEGVTALCEIALGTTPGLRAKVRANAIALLGSVEHPQVHETLMLLVKDPDERVVIRAMRAAGRLKSTGVTAELARVLKAPATTPLVAAEAVKALRSLDTAPALDAVNAYRDATPNALAHRASVTVRDVLARTPGE